MKFEDYEERADFSAHDLEHILGLPIGEIVELFAKVPRAPKGRFQGGPCRELIAKYARKRVFADLIARQVVNAEPDVRRAAEQPDDRVVALVDRSTDHHFTVRFPGDLRDYLEQARATQLAAEEAAAAERAAQAEADAEADAPTDSE